MVDLTLGYGIILGTAVILFAYGRRVERGATVIAAIAATFLLWQAAFLQGSVFLIRWLPVSAAIALADWFPLGASLLAGIISRQPKVPHVRRVFYTCFLSLAGWGNLMSYFLPPRTEPVSRFVQGVCVQTSRATCSPCSAVTLLDHYQIPANEREMTRLCLTNWRGTSSLGLYRGLTLKTRGTPWKVEAIDCSLEVLRDHHSLPAILFVRFESNRETRGVLSDLWRRETRIEHCVVFLGLASDGSVIIGDPANSRSPRVRWSQGDLRRRWTGKGFRFVLRE